MCASSAAWIVAAPCWACLGEGKPLHENKHRLYVHEQTFAQGMRDHAHEVRCPRPGSLPPSSPYQSVGGENLVP